jgi:hypothetical protein
VQQDKKKPAVMKSSKENDISGWAEEGEDPLTSNLYLAPRLYKKVDN